MKALAALTYLGSFLCLLIASKTSSFIKVTKYNAQLNYLKLLLPLFLILLANSVLATRNPSVSHSADGVTNWTFQDNYTNLEVAP